MSIDTTTRRAGILMPIFSIPSKYGIGCFSREAYEFVDELAVAGQRFWQILPIGPMGGSNSPYQPHSCYAGEPLFIDPEILVHRGMLTKEELAEHTKDLGDDPQYVDYAKIRESRIPLLRIAFSRFEPTEAFERFCLGNRDWLEDYALFEALAKHFGTYSWSTWDTPARFRIRWKLAEYREQLKVDVWFYKWIQFEFFRQWSKLKHYANKKGVQIIGDVPIYAALESADCWADPQLFKLDTDSLPKKVSGAPPDDFNPKGQVWGNPLYDWKMMKKYKYRWWIHRLAHNLELYDVVRLDHTRGFESYFAIPAGSDDAGEGSWEQGPGSEFFDVVREKLGDCDLIAEDLGNITPEVMAMVEASGLPRMRVLQFAFDGDPSNPHIPRNSGANSVMYTGTHDNDTTRGWYTDLTPQEKRWITDDIRRFAGTYQSSEEPILGASEAVSLMTDLALNCDAALCIIPVQDYLDLGSEARVNTPGTIENNWKWRMTPGMFGRKQAKAIAEQTKAAGR